ncbi:site-specific integrase [Trichlorobacter lovleyi]|uniref:site-specific integrase n=1 Tax=Trichlorobacter lovleyi TaxID=313985 RepID=UPI00223FC5B7|nr:site-specific integrase [Trichlorobacter lovleyi]QOX78634.1 site-specific integrase [Trichlorobacter lovleyi]
MLFYLHKIGAIYYYRRRVPDDIRHYFPYPEIRLSLKTGNQRFARSLMRGLLGKTEKLFLQIRSGMLSESMIHNLVLDFISESLGRRDEIRKDMDSAEHEMLSDWANEFASDVSETHKQMLARGQMSGYPAMRVRELLQAKQIAFDEQSPAFRLLCREILVAEQKIADTDVRRLVHGDYRSELDEQLRRRGALPDNSVPQPSEGLADIVRGELEKVIPVSPYRDLHLARLIELYEESKAGFWTKSTAEKLQGDHRKILHILGDISVSDITQQLVNQFCADLLHYPKAIKGNQLETPWQELSRSVSARLSEKSRTIIRTQLASLIKYAKNVLGCPIVGDPTVGLVSSKRGRNYEVQNPPQHAVASGQAASVEVSVAAKQRGFYEQNELQGMLLKLSKQNRVERPDKYWIPLVLLYTGARANEICQLRTDDIVTAGDIPFICIKEDLAHLQSTKDHKNREVPIHPHLVELGFLDYVRQQRRRKSDRLWSALKPDKKDKWNKLFGNWFNGTLKKYFVNDTNQDLHTLRHTFITAMVSNVDTSFKKLAVLKGIIGHVDGADNQLMQQLLDKSEMTLRYTHTTQQEKFEYLSQLDYGLDFSCLKKW